MEYMVFKEHDALTGKVRCIIRDRRGRKFGDFGEWKIAQVRATQLNFGLDNPHANFPGKYVEEDN